MKALREIVIPGHVELAEDTNKELHSLWRRNNKILIQRLLKEKLPFFGLHGTSKPRLQSIEQKGGYFNIGTFYKAKQEPKELLATLYMMANYTSDTLYTDKEGEGLGGLIIVKCGENENETSQWEPLRRPQMPLTFDSKPEIKLISDVAQNAWRSTIGISGKNDNAYKGTYACKENLYSDFGEMPDCDSFAKVVMQTRFRCQDIVRHCMDLFKE